jgi:hypothetical protein
MISGDILAWRGAKIVGAIVLLVFIWWAISQLLGYREGRALQRAETATDTAVAAIEAGAGAADVAAQAERHRVVVDVVQRRTIDVATASRAAPAGDTRLPDDSADRLRAHDGFLCETRPAIC